MSLLLLGVIILGSILGGVLITLCIVRVCPRKPTSGDQGEETHLTPSTATFDNSLFMRDSQAPDWRSDCTKRSRTSENL